MRTREEITEEAQGLVKITDSFEGASAVLLDSVLETLLDIRELLIEQNKK